MQQLEFTELDEGGRLVLTADDGTRYAVPVDDRLRAALRPRPHAPTPERGSATTPREVQMMIRAGQTAEEVAAATGWELVRVQRFEGPVVAEREHVVGLAKAAPVRAQGRTDGSHTLERRVRERLQSRGVALEDVTWDASRSRPQSPWTVVVSFLAGGAERRATWHYEVADRSLDALDDEARWLSEDEQALPGGLAGHPLLGTATATDEANDLMATMRARRRERTGGRRPRSTAAQEQAGARVTPETHAPEAPAPEQGGGMVDEVLPLEDFDFDPATMGDPPAAHPRGSAAESPTPVNPEPDDTTAKASRRERRRLRLPKLPPAVAAAEDADVPSEPDGAFARTRHDPHEVSFDEFFGTGEEDELELDALPEAVDDKARQEVSDEDAEDADDEDTTVEEIDGDEDVDEEDAEDTSPVAGSTSDEPMTGGRKKGRTSVPSWDDIMFGSGPRKG